MDKLKNDLILEQEIMEVGLVFLSCMLDKDFNEEDTKALLSSLKKLDSKKRETMQLKVNLMLGSLKKTREYFNQFFNEMEKKEGGHATH